MEYEVIGTTETGIYATVVEADNPKQALDLAIPELDDMRANTRPYLYYRVELIEPWEPDRSYQAGYAYASGYYD